MNAGRGSSEVGDGVLVVLPTYNEKENITSMLADILENAPAAHVLVVDDGSPDGTGALAQATADADPRVTVLERGGKLGLGTAYVEGFRYALARDYRFVVTMDADYSHHPRYLPAILAEAARPGADLVIGSRYVRGGGVTGWGAHRRVLSYGANTFARTLLRLRPRDCTGGFRCYSRHLLETLDLAGVVSHGYSALMELLWNCRKAGFAVHEVPIIFADRELGQSKISRGEIGRGLTTVMRLRFGRTPTRRRDPVSP